MFDGRKRREKKVVIFNAFAFSQTFFVCRKGGEKVGKSQATSHLLYLFFNAVTPISSHHRWSMNFVLCRSLNPHEKSFFTAAVGRCTITNNKEHNQQQQSHTFSSFHRTLTKKREKLSRWENGRRFMDAKVFLHSSRVTKRKIGC